MRRRMTFQLRIEGPTVDIDLDSKPDHVQWLLVPPEWIIRVVHVLHV